MQRIPLQEITDRTAKQRDAWWTVLLVDPLAIRLVRLVYPYRWITPNLLSAFAFVLGLGAAACFALQDRWWLVGGALLFHLSFVVDCMDGKIARLNGTGTIFGVWFDFIFDRIRVIICTVALFGGQYAKTDDVTYVWLAAAVICLDLFRYLNGSQVGKIKSSMAARLADARGARPEVPSPDEEESDPEDASPATSAEPAPIDDDRGAYLRFRNWLLRSRIRVHLFSGIEYEMTVFIVGPVIGFVFWTTIVSGVLLLGFEALIVLRLYQLTRRFPAMLAKAEHEGEAARLATAGGLTPAGGEQAGGLAPGHV
ncbi:CDP-alcohol phosphatidyltransferase family protein [Actinoplanes sp. NPDC049265]|uniref:CDP-alcohol phosphatidyltransferase family protein n=1 Tax=Actinoplanes sp. NPDC049265 TaxID=3363902 RepID=UPI003714E43C